MRHSHRAECGLIVRPIMLLLAVVMLFARPLVAQTPAPGDTALSSERALIGRVVDDAFRGLPEADVRVASWPTTLTDREGHFTLRSLPSGAFQLVVRKVGYDSASVRVPATVRTPTESVTVVLTRSHRLNDIVVEGQAYDRTLWDRGFYHRQKVASGMFFDPDAIVHFGGDGLGSLVRQVPRVDVRRINNEDHAFSTIGGRSCRMNIYVDGMFQREAMPDPRIDGNEGIGLSQLVDVRDIAAVEVYPRASAVPTQFQRMGPPAGPQGYTSAQIGSPSGRMHRSMPQGENADAACGAIVIWTKAPTNAGSPSPNP